MTTIQYVAAVALSLVAFVGAANVVVDLYLRGVVRSALDEGARAGVPVDADANVCAERVRSVLGALLGASTRTVHVACSDGGGEVRATAELKLPSWLPGMPAWELRLDAVSIKEVVP